MATHRHRRTPSTVVNSTIWLVAREQASMSHDVALVVDSMTEEGEEIAKRWGLHLHVLNWGLRDYHRGFRRMLSEQRPDVLHLHSTFTPQLAVAARLADRAGIPYVITPHGGVSPHVLRRGWAKKTIYSHLVERPRFRRAAAITALQPDEVREIKAFVPTHPSPPTIVPSHIDGHLAGIPATSSREGPVIFLGRLDLWHKGLHRWVEIAARLPDVRFEIYGEGPDRDELERRSPPNVLFRDPVFGAEKHRLLASAAMYLQTSRWDAFPVSICEAMLPFDRARRARTRSRPPARPRSGGHSARHRTRRPAECRCASRRRQGLRPGALLRPRRGLRLHDRLCRREPERRLTGFPADYRRPSAAALPVPGRQRPPAAAQPGVDAEAA
jgi:glycosyltransferase involved in cell wall biosynthesis